MAFWATWRFGRELFTPLEAFVAVVILDGSIEYGFNTTAFNHNILELPFFAFAGWSLYRAFVGNALRDWLLVGLWFALAFYTKYQAFVLLLPVLAFAVVDPHARQCWRKPGPYVAAAVSAVLCTPQFRGWRSSTTSARSNSPKARPSPPYPCLISCGRH